MSTLPIVAIVGRANVGKSTLFNRLVGERQAITDDQPGTTRDSVQALAHWGGYNFWLVDTAGLHKSIDELDIQVQHQVRESAASAQVIVLVADATTMINNEDKEAARLALKTGKPVILVLNKIDAAAKGIADDYERLGVKQIIQVSALHGRGTGDLMDALTAEIKKMPEPKNDGVIHLAILGRPNVGKSSLLNSLVGKQSAIVSERAGTTRDVNSAEIKYQRTPIKLLDTAGLRRRGKIEAGVEKYSALRTLAAINQADICVVVMDATQPSVAGDQHIAGMVVDAGKGLILAVNKWDLVEKEDKTQARLARHIQNDFQFAWWAPLIFTSAVTGNNVSKLMEVSLQIAHQRKQEISTPKLNSLLTQLKTKQPPAGLKSAQPKLNYMTQTGTNPPVFTFFGSSPSMLHFSYKRYLENGLREAYDFTGTPIKLVFRSKRKGEI